MMLAALKSKRLPRALRYLSYTERSARGVLSRNGNNIVVKWAHSGCSRAAPKNEQENEWWTQAYAVLR